jgi:hypothetical protein
MYADDTFGNAAQSSSSKFPLAFYPYNLRTTINKLTFQLVETGPSPRAKARIQTKIKREETKDAAEQHRLHAERQGIVRRASLVTPVPLPDMEAAAAAVPDIEATSQQRLRSSQGGAPKTKSGSTSLQPVATNFVPPLQTPGAGGERTLLHLQGTHAGAVESGPSRAFSFETDGQQQPQLQPQPRRRRRGSAGSSGSAASNRSSRSQRISFATQ